MKIRCVVAGTAADGRSRVFEDATAPSAVDFDRVLGFAATLLWTAGPDMQLAHGAPQDRTDSAAFVPAPGETLLLFVTFRPTAR